MVTRRYLAIYRHGPGNLSGFVPDIPGCGSIGHSMEEMRENLHDALEFYLEGLILRGKPIPEPSVGPEDLCATGFVEWLVVRIRIGDQLGPRTLVRPCPGR